MTDFFQRLAQKLDELPNGYPPAGGLELKILRKIFTPEDAEMALQLRPMPESAASLAQRLGRPEQEMTAILDRMARRGQIGSFTVRGRQMYLLMPFVIGIYEFQLNHIDRELAELFDQYNPTLMKILGGAKPSLARVVPVNQTIPTEHQILLFEDVRRMIEESRSFVVRDCICRKKNGLRDKPCRHTLETCLGISPEEHAYDYFTHAGRIITKEEALAVLDAAAREGLIHCTYNVQQGHRWICNCCSCCCELIISLRERIAPFALAGSRFRAEIDADSCSACGTCADERCGMEAIIGDEGAYRVLADRCIGCGVCAITCPTESIRLIPRAADECESPPESLPAWIMTRMKNRAAAEGRNSN